MLKIIVAIVVVALAVTLATVLIRFNVKRRHIIRSAAAATEDQLEAIYAQLEQLGTEPPNCAILARTNRRSMKDQDWIIPVPSYVETPAAGRAISASAGKDVAFGFSATTATEPIVRGQVYRIVPVPRSQTKTGKSRNRFSPDKYVAGNSSLHSLLSAVCPKYPTELLCYLFAAGAETFEFDTIDQARIGGSPAWVQDAEFPVCTQCQKRMTLILQLPGSMLPGKQLPEGTFYFFGCKEHPDVTQTVEQFA